MRLAIPAGHIERIYFVLLRTKPVASRWRPLVGVVVATLAAVGLVSTVNASARPAVDSQVELVAHSLPVGNTQTLNLSCDAGMVWRDGPPKLHIGYASGGVTLDATEGVDYTIHTENFDAQSIQWTVTAHSYPVAGSTDEWEADAFGVCTDGQPEPTMRARERSVLGRLGRNLKTTFSKFTDIFAKRAVLPVGDDTTTMDQDGPPSGIAANDTVRLLMCNFGSARTAGSTTLVAVGEQATYVDETTGIWYYPSAVDKHSAADDGNGDAHWKRFSFPIPASDGRASFTPGCGKARATDPTDRPMYFTTTLTMQSGCRGGWKYFQWTVVGNFICSVVNGPQPAAAVIATFGASNVRSADLQHPILTWPLDSSAPVLPSVTAPVANMESVQPFLSSTPGTQRLGIFEGATDANYVTVQGQSQVKQLHPTYLYPPTPIFGDTVGNGSTNVGYIGVRQQAVNGKTITAIEKSIPNSGPGDSSVFREAVPMPQDVTVDNLRTVQWQLTSPTSTIASQDGIELQTTVPSMHGYPGNETGCVDIWPGAGNYATRRACPGMRLNGAPVGDSNFASLFAIRPVHPVFGTASAGRVYFQSVVPGQHNQCLTHTGGTTATLAPCRPAEDPNQQFDIRATYASGSARTDGAVKIVNIATLNAMAPRNDDSIGVDFYASPKADQNTQYADYVWWRLRIPALYVS